MNHVADILRNTGLFAGISDQEMIAMSKCLGARRQRYGSGEYLFRSGDSAEELCVVLEGTVDIVKQDWWGNSAVLSSNGPGSVVCTEYACAHGENMDVSVVSSGQSEVLFLEIAKVTRVCKSTCEFHSRLIGNLVQILARDALALDRRLERMCKRTTRDKVRAYLSDQARLAGGNEFTVPLNRQEMADHLGVDRSALSAELGRMKNDGILDFTKNRFTLIVGGAPPTRP